MGSARRIAIALSAVLAVATSVASMALWPLVQKNDLALVDHVQHDVAFGWLLLQAATPLFAICLLTTLGSTLLALGLAIRQAGRDSKRQA